VLRGNLEVALGISADVEDLKFLLEGVEFALGVDNQQREATLQEFLGHDVR